MLMWYIIFVLLILFTGGGLLYLGTRAAKFVPTGRIFSLCACFPVYLITAFVS